MKARILVFTLMLLVGLAHQSAARSKQNTAPSFTPDFDCSTGRKVTSTTPSLCDRDSNGVVSEAESRRYTEYKLLHAVFKGDVDAFLHYREQLGAVNMASVAGVPNTHLLYKEGLPSYLPPLHLAAMLSRTAGHADIVDILCEDGVSRGAVRGNLKEYHHSALTYAYLDYFEPSTPELKDQSIAERIIARLHRAGAHAELGVLQLAVRSGCDTCVDRLLTNTQSGLPRDAPRIGINDVNGENATALHYAVNAFVTSNVDVLLKYHARVDIRDSGGRNALHYAVYHHDARTLREMMDKGEGVEEALMQKDRFGRTPAESAIASGTLPEVFQVLGIDESARVPLLTTPVQSVGDDEAGVSGGWTKVTDASDIANGDLKEIWEQSRIKCDIDRVAFDDMTLGRFVRDYLSLGRPVVLTGGVTRARDNGSWSGAFRHWAHGALQERYGHLSVLGGNIPYAETYGSRHFEQTDIHEFIEDVMSHSREGPASGEDADWILFDMTVARMDPRFLGDYRTPSFFRLCGNPSLPQLSIGSLSSGAPLHAHVAAWNALVYGKKHWFLMAPGTHKNKGILRANTNVPTSEWMASSQFKNLREQGDLLECTQHQGEIFYVPYEWGHATVNLEDSVAIAQEFCSHDPRGEFFRHAMYGPADGETRVQQPITQLYFHDRGESFAPPAEYHR